MEVYIHKLGNMRFENVLIHFNSFTPFKKSLSSITYTLQNFSQESEMSKINKFETITLNIIRLRFEFQHKFKT